MFNKKTIALLLVASLLLGFLGMSSAAFAEPEAKPEEVVLFHLNDTHGRAAENKDPEKAAKEKIIGYARLKTYKDLNKNALLLDAGDTLHGTTFATISRGKSIVRLMNEAGVDVFVPGNHDFNYGYPRLLELVKQAKFSVVAANVKEEKDGTYPMDGHVIKEINGKKIGIFGLATPETRTKSNPLNTEGVEFEDYIEVAKREVKALQDEKVDAIVLLCHLGIDESSDERSDIVAEKVEGIDVVIDGHSHTLLKDGMTVGNTLIAQTGEHMQNLGKVTLTFNGDKLVNKKAEILSYDDLKNVTPDEGILKSVEEIEKENKPFLEEFVGRTEVDLEGKRENVRTGETNLGNLLTDAMLDISKADVAITNGGGIRATIPKGDIRMQDILNSFPFTNYPVKLEVTGKTILEALEYGVDKAPDVVGKFPHVGGMTFKYDPKQEPGSRVFDVLVKGEPIDLDKKYTLVTNDFMAVGGDGYEMFKDAVKLSEHPLLSEVLADYIKAHSPVAPKVEGRVVVADKPADKPEDPKAPEFTDIVGHWAEKYINDVVKKGIFNGMTDTTFEPNTKISRAMVVTVLGRFEEKMNKDFKPVDATFKDITDPNAWYAKYVGWAAENEIVKGYEDGTFKPGQEVTREEMAVMIARYLGYKEVPVKDVKPQEFKDADKIADWAKESIDHCVNAGILNGREDGTFDPKGNGTRGELAKILSVISEIEFPAKTEKPEEKKEEGKDEKKEEVKDEKKDEAKDEVKDKNEKTETEKAA
ncbi:MAG: 5'-nucleotidase C-terminal domain-containing protein [Tissierellia bacterium]|nr:5'-nucleotidase C-terminal domain-containing protein [Tissierellia bacterium]